MIDELYRRVSTIRVMLTRFRIDFDMGLRGVNPDRERAIRNEIEGVRNNLAVIKEHLLLLAYDNDELDWVDPNREESSSD